MRMIIWIKILKALFSLHGSILDIGVKIIKYMTHVLHEERNTQYLYAVSPELAHDVSAKSKI